MHWFQIEERRYAVKQLLKQYTLGVTSRFRQLYWKHLWLLIYIRKTDKIIIKILKQNWNIRFNPLHRISVWRQNWAQSAFQLMGLTTFRILTF